MAKSTYWELLKHPKWQEKRLRILDRDEFTCTDCGDTSKTLHVHHGYYAKGLSPWEYPDETLRTLCEDCHAKAQNILSKAHEQLGRLHPSDLGKVVGYARCVEVESQGGGDVLVESYAEALGVACYFSTNPGFVIDNLSELGTVNLPDFLWLVQSVQLEAQEIRLKASAE